jgi:copper transport protein
VTHARLRAIVVAWLLLCLWQPQAALAHASLISSDPSNDALLMHPPTSVRLTFNEDVDVLAIRLIDENGASAPMADIDNRGASLLLTPAKWHDGANVVSWRVISADGHPVGGSLTFWVGRRGSAPPEIATAANAPLRAAIWATRLLIYAGLFVAVGGAFFLAWLRPTRRSVMPLAGVGVVALAALVVSIALQGIDVLAASLWSWTRPAIWIAGARGSFGAQAGIAAVAVLLGLASLATRGTMAKIISLLAMLGTGVALAASGHAASAEPRDLTMLAVFMHGVSLAFWIGALWPLCLALRDNSERSTVLLLRFSRWIPLAIAALLASGTLLAVVQLQQPDALWTTNYGRVFVVKLALVALLLALALWNRARLTPAIVKAEPGAHSRLRRAIVQELVLVALILAVVGLWRFTPPPRALALVDNEPFFTHLHTEKAMANVTIAPGRAGPVEIAIQLETADERPLKAQALSVTLSNPQAGIEPFSAEAERAGDTNWRVNMSAPVAGRWTLTLGILISDFDKVTIEAPIVIR